MCPQSDEYLLVLTDLLRISHHAALENTCHVSEIERVVRLRRSWQKLLQAPLENFKRRLTNRSDNRLHRGRKIRLKMRRQYVAKNHGNAFVCQFWECKVIEVAQEAVGDNLTTAPGRPHSSQEQNVDDCVFLGRFAVIPSLVVHPLAQYFNRGLCKVHFTQRHVHVIDEKHVLFACRRSIDAFAPLVHLAIDDILSLVRGGLGRKHQEKWRVIFRHSIHDFHLHGKSLSSTSGSNAKHML